MSGPSRFEVVHTGPRKFHARFVAGNGETVWVTESHTTRRAAREAIAVIQPGEWSQQYETGPRSWRSAARSLATPLSTQKGGLV